ncbi:hypothetical protein MNEG_5817 [Monoraphidium neglectum]|uniref:Uncharacterized protein n=1 Tax=Monoraphidium neglectum TaxID=145388 RepID=A0A0D2MGC6_9CHLO|nr:hypothetical protein MNEG_5817 [Monoraphidium neglectum]KIZ02140.1 hypothetical protein MNEG_5817 [Monoraphidium neglectum]|eukprot:XP_013901159.1 hypothetical protein MNEG_5817 [Monoraphidium neglectum]
MAVVNVGCGGDTLTSGSINVLPSNGRVAVTLKGASQINLYEVYWLPFGAPFSSAYLIGNIATDCRGNSISPTARPIANGREALATLNLGPRLSAAAPALSSGVFLLYSRGPYGGSAVRCKPTTFNTVVSPTDSSRTNAFANPAVNLNSSIVQFMSGYQT